jgi:type IV secretory pathway VirB2 component (pilin)
MVLLPVLLAVILAALDCQMAGVLYRYLSDYLTPLLFAAALVWLWAESALAPRVQAAASGSILHTVQHMLQGAMLAAVAVGICYSFCVYFAAEPGLLGQNPALYQNVSRLVQFWL